MKLCTTYACAFLLTLVYGSPTPVLSPTITPTITPAARLRRANLETFAWTSNSTENGETFYSPWRYNPEKSTWTTSDLYFRRCSVSSTCNMWTACSEGWMVGKSTSSSCGAGGAAGSVFCSNNILFESMGATRTYSWYWCDSAPVTGFTFYEKEPQQPTRASASSPASTDASTTATTATTATDTDTATATPSQSRATTSAASPSATSNPKFSVSIGNVAGGIVGGLVGLAAIGFGIFFFLRRRKRKALYAPPTEHQNPFASPAATHVNAYEGVEAKPAGVADGTYYGGPAYPQGPYDPHMSMYGAHAEMDGGSSTNYAHRTSDVPLQPMNAAELPSQPIAPQELPAQR